MGKNRHPTPSLAKLARPVSTRVFARERTFDLLDRLRRLISYEKALLLHEGRLTLDESYCWVDVWAFVRDSFPQPSASSRLPKPKAFIGL